MTKEEIAEHVAADNLACKKVLRKFHDDWKKVCGTRCRTLPFHKTYEYYCEKSRQRYYMLFANVPTFRRQIVTKVAEVIESGRTYYVVCNKPSSNPHIDLISSHCINRMLERLGIERADIMENLFEYFMHSIFNVSIYDHEDKCVFAGSHGLMLCEKKDNDGLLFYRTFVSTDMLKSSQSAAYDKIINAINATIEMLKRCSTKEEFQMVIATMTLGMREYRDAAQEIYKTYFENEI